MNEISDFRRDFNGTTRKMLDEITAFQNNTLPQESINKEKIIKEFDEMTNSQSQTEIDNLMKWAKTQKEKCKDFNENLKITKNAAKALDETIDFGIQNVNATMNEWNKSLFKARNDLMSLTTRFNELLESFGLSQEISGADMRDIDIPSLKIETRLATNDELKTMTMEDQLKQMQARERYYLTIIKSAQKLAMQMKIDLSSLTKDNENMHNNIVKMESRIKELNNKLEEKTSQADEYLKAVIRMNEISINRDICNNESIDILTDKKKLCFKNNQIFGVFDGKIDTFDDENEQGTNYSVNENSLLNSEDEHLLGLNSNEENSSSNDNEKGQNEGNDSFVNGKSSATNGENGSNLKSGSNSGPNCRSPRNIKTCNGIRTNQRDFNSRNLTTSSGRRNCLLNAFGKEEEEENGSVFDDSDYKISNNHYNEEEISSKATQTMMTSLRDLRVVIPPDSDDDSLLYKSGVRPPELSIPPNTASPRSAFKDGVFDSCTSSRSLSYYEDPKSLSLNQFQTSESTRDFSFLGIHDRFASSNRSPPSTPGIMKKGGGGRIISPKVSPRQKAMQTLKEILERDRKDALVKRESSPNPFQIIHIDI